MGRVDNNIEIVYDIEAKVLQCIESKQQLESESKATISVDFAISLEQLNDRQEIFFKRVWTKSASAAFSGSLLINPKNVQDQASAAQQWFVNSVIDDD